MADQLTTWVNTALVEWQALAQNWSFELAESLYNKLEYLGDYATNFDLAELRQPAVDFCIYLSSFVEVKPNEQHLEELKRLAAELEAAVRPAPSADAAIAVVMVGPQNDEWQAAFQREQLQLRTVLTGTALADALKQGPPRALICPLRTLEQIRPVLDQWSKTQRSPQIVLITVDPNPSPASRVEASLADVDLNLERPSPAVAAAEVRSVLNSQKEQASYRVLLVDDDPQIAIFVGAVLKANGMVFKAVETAQQAMLEVSSFKPHLLLVDLNLPGVGGLELTAELRRRSDSLILPIVFLSGDTSDTARFSALKVGGDDFLTKPIHPRHLVTAVRTRIKRVRALAQRAQVSVTQGYASANASGAPAATAASNPGLRPSSRLQRRGEWLEALRDASMQQGSEPRALLLLRVDQAKQLSEQLGMLAQSGLETAIGGRIAEQIGARDALCLMQPFVFALLVFGLRQQEVAGLADSVLHHVNAVPFQVAISVQKITLSIGICLDPVLHNDPDKWFNAAHTAALMAQRTGGNRIEGVMSGLPPGVSQERAMQIRTLLDRPLDRSRLQIEYVPWLPLRDNAAGFYELRAHLSDPREPLNPIPRAQFASFASELGLLSKIDQLAAAFAVESMIQQATMGRVERVLLHASADYLAQMREPPSRVLAPDSFIFALSCAELLRCEARMLDGIAQMGASICALVSEQELGLVESMRQLPLSLLWISARLLNDAERAAAVSQVREICTAQRWKLLVGDVAEHNLLARLWHLGTDFAQGNALAAPGSRMDFDFSEIAL